MMKSLRGSIAAASIALLIQIALSGCKGVPEGVLGEQQLAEVMADLQFADAIVNESDMRGGGQPMNDSTRLGIMQAVLDRHGITQADYDSTLRWYGHHMVRYVDACERADSILADSIRAVDRRIAQARANRGGGADTINVWPHSPAHLFTPRIGGDYLTFEVPRDTSWRKGDIYIWEMTPINNRTPLQARMIVEYADNRLTHEVTEMASHTDRDPLTMTVQLDSTKTARRIYGFIYMPAEEGENAFISNVSLLRTRLDSENYHRGRRMVKQIYGAPRINRNRPQR